MRCVTGTDGVAVNARSWASAAKAAMKQAAAPEEKARPYILQQVVTIKRAKSKFISWHPYPFVCVCACVSMCELEVTFTGDLILYVMVDHMKYSS